MIAGDSPGHKFKVIIGPQTCTCAKSFCNHLLFVMLRVFKVRENDPILWSSNLKNFEVETLFSRFHARVNSRLAKNSSSKSGRGKSPQRVTPPPSTPEAAASSSAAAAAGKEDEEVCPICLLEMVEGESLTCCTGGCNNTLHQHCMEIWAAECRLRKERLNCPLCRRILPPEAAKSLSDRSPTGPKFLPCAPDVPNPLEPGEVITLPHSNPIPTGQVDLARPWVQAFGEELVSCLFSREWNIREIALRRLSRDIYSYLRNEGSNLTDLTAVEASCSLLTMMCGDPVYRVYVAALRTLRVMLAHTNYTSRDEKMLIQSYLHPVVEAILAKCSDGNRRISALSMKVLLEFCKDESGDLALGRMLRDHRIQPMGGLGFMLACILTTAHEYATWPWWLGRLYFLRKLLDEYVEDFQLGGGDPAISDESVGVILQDHHQVDGTEIFSDNPTRLMSVMKFAILAAQCSHSKVTKFAVSVLTCCTSLAAGCPSAFVHIKKLVSKLKPSQRSILQRRLATLARRNNSLESSDSEGTVSEASTVLADDVQGGPSDGHDCLQLPRPRDRGCCSASCTDDETDNLSDNELLQSIVESLQRPHHLALHSPPPSPTRDVESLDWTRSEGESPRFPPVKVVMGGKCQQIIEEEEAVALAKAMELSALQRGPQKIRSLQPDANDPEEDEMVIVYTQPESLDKAANTKHLYLENVHWKKGELLGTGAFSSCYGARDVMTGSLMAVKQVSFCRNSKSEQDKVCQTIMDEIAILARLKHPHLIKCLGATRHTGHFNIFLEWMAGGSISMLLSKYGPFEEAILIRYLRQILQGVSYLHENQVVHRDIKGANILVDSTGQDIRIADFGAAARLATQITGAGEFQGQLLGTIAFMAPEVLRGESYGRSCDVWSVGCVLIEMATGKPPWNAHEHSNHLALIFKIACAIGPPDIPEHLNPGVRDVVLRCLESKPEDRPAAVDLLQHPLFTIM
ncbi:mitogen-activated protein kinase kinase kinase 1 isoform X2 [Nematostella vectensis]|uniref:mitogen-activated protein kinase kinase kinase 1 isoform X2 n=1 Tax=Nematostella vectensis TaxID=45351 RepID=UPI00207715CB|nr:mitogen-activated protein kinase kinase kinase 1 isoform X2 [Nematostella vectensis]